MLITVSSVRGAPGATSWSLLLAAAWPEGAGGDRLVIEADCAGGVLGARYQLGVDPGTVEMMSGVRRHGGLPPLDAYGRPFAEQLWVVPGPEVAEAATRAWTGAAAELAPHLAADRRVCVADLGRSGPASPVRPLAESAAVNVVVSGPEVEDLVQLPARLAGLGHGAAAVVIVGRPAYSAEELHGLVDCDLLRLVPKVDALPRVVLQAVRGGRARRSLVWRAAVDLAADLALIVSRSAADSPPPPAPGAEPSDRYRAPTEPDTGPPAVSPAMAAAMASARRRRR